MCVSIIEKKGLIVLLLDAMSILEKAMRKEDWLIRTKLSFSVHAVIGNNTLYAVAIPPNS